MICAVDGRVHAHVASISTTNAGVRAYSSAACEALAHCMPTRNSPWLSGTPSMPSSQMRGRSSRAIRSLGRSSRTIGHSTALASENRSSASTSGGNSATVRLATRNVPLEISTLSASEPNISAGRGRDDIRAR